MRSLIRTSLALLTLAAVGCSSTAGSHGDGSWQLLGTRDVTSQVDYDVVVVEPPRKLRALKLVVRGSPIRMYGVRVQLSGGETLDLPVGSVIPAGGEAPVIEVPAGRAVERVVFRYEAASLFGSLASVSLYGRD